MSFISSLTGKQDSGLEKKKVSELIPYDRNPNTHPESQIEQLANSIRQWGWTMPILIDENGMVIAGHGRLYAAQRLEMEEVPCISVSGWTEEQKKAYVIADNKLGEGSQWDDSLYFSELRNLSDSGYDLSLLGMDDNFSFDDFEPNVNPTYNSGNFTDIDVGNAQAKLDGQINGLSKEKSDGGTEVLCPNCYESFVVTGH